LAAQTGHPGGARPRAAAGRRGAVLVLALCTLFVLGALGLGVGRYVAAGIRMAGRLESGTAAWCLARAAAERAILEAVADTNGWDSLDESWSGASKRLGRAPLGGGWCEVRRPAEPGVGPDAAPCGLTDEESRVNVNTAWPDLLRAFVENAGGVDSVSARNVAAAILDWRDADDDLRPGGGESGYYGERSPPYACGNGNLGRPEELLLVRGVDAELYRRLAPFFTVYGSGKVNINTAPAAVLRAVMEAWGRPQRQTAEGIVEKLLAFRGAGRAFRAGDPVSMTADLNGYAVLSPEETRLFMHAAELLTVRSTCFRGTAVGRSEPGGEERRIDFVFDRVKQARLYWFEERP